MIVIAYIDSAWQAAAQNVVISMGGNQGQEWSLAVHWQATPWGICHALL
jgi:hypothetical protein